MLPFQTALTGIYVNVGSYYIMIQCLIISQYYLRYFETISDVLSSVRKMEESLKRLKQARKTATTSTAGANIGPSDDSKIRLQLALDVEYLGEQVPSAQSTTHVLGV